jgi:hypothetical protein
MGLEDSGLSNWEVLNFGPGVMGRYHFCGEEPCTLLPLITEINRIQSVLFGMHNRTCRPYMAACLGFLIPVMPGCTVAGVQIETTLQLIIIRIWFLGMRLKCGWIL